MSYQLVCNDIPTDTTADGCPSGWQIVDNSDWVPDLINAVTDLQSFDPAIAAKLVIMYLVMFVTGVGAGMVMRTMRRA